MTRNPPVCRTTLHAVALVLAALAVACRSPTPAASEDNSSSSSSGTPASILAVTSVSPGRGPAAGGTTLVVAGQGFSAGANVTIGGVPATSVVVHDSAVITAVTPPGAPGRVDVTVTLAAGTTHTLAAAFTYELADALALASVQPVEGPLEGGGVAILRGSGFRAGATVRFGQAVALDVEVTSSSVIACTIPRGVAGAVDVVVANPGSEETRLAAAYTYVETSALGVAAVMPASGSAVGGELLMVSGAGFTPGMTATLGGVDAQVMDVPSRTVLLLMTPAHAAGHVDLVVTRPDLATATRVAAFEYVGEPGVTPPFLAVSTVVPSSGPEAGGTPVQVVGSGFEAGATVWLGDTAAVTRYVDAAHLVAVTPAGSGAVAVKVVNPGGASSTLAGAFTFAPLTAAAPTLVRLSPVVGPTVGGTRGVMEGTGFVAGASVLFGDRAAAGVEVLSAQQLVFVSPASSPGSVDVTVVNPDGQHAVLSNGFGFFVPGSIVAPTPALASLTPRSGWTAGGETVTLAGAGLVTGSAVYFGSAPALVTSASGSAIQVVTPPAAAGSTDVSVTTPMGMTATLPGGFVYFEIPPTILAVEPASGPVAGGNSVVIRGTHFASSAAVRVGGVFTTSTVFESENELRVTMPPHGEGAVDVKVINPNGLSHTLAGAYTYAPPVSPQPPVVTAVSPGSGPAGGGVLVVINGSRFADGATVRFGTTASAQVVVYGQTVLTAVVPAGVVGPPVDVTVTNPDGLSGTLAGGFVYSQAGLGPLSFAGAFPAQGLTTGGTVITINGAGFATGMAVDFGLVPARSVAYVSPTVLTVVTPVLTAGLTDIVLRRPDQQQVVAYNAFLVADPAPGVSTPSIAAVSPGVGPLAGGTLVTVSGQGFEGGASVAFGGTDSAQVTVVSPTVITARAPAGTAGTVSISVANVDGGTAVLAAGFTYYNPGTAVAPSVLALNPYQGSALGGTAITVIGTGFQAAVSLYVCSARAEITSATATQINALSPAGPVGLCSVVAVNPDGLAGTLADGFRLVAPQPEVTSLLPTTGASAGGTSVRVLGAGFLTGAEVYFGTSRATAVQVWDANTIVATTPAASAGAVDVRVVNPGGTQVVKANAFTYADDPGPLVPPTITVLVPAQGPVAGGTPVEVRGTGFKAGAAVTVGGSVPAQVTVVSDTVIVFVTEPAGQSGSVPVTVLNPDGLGATRANAFEYLTPTAPAPQLLGMSPSSGPAAGGTPVTLSGQNLAAGGLYYLGGQPLANVALVNSSLVTALTPAGTAGAATLRYVGPDGQVVDRPNAFTFIAAPSVASIAPTFGSLAGGTEVAIVGDGFRSGLTVGFGTGMAQVIAVQSAQLITVAAPQSAAPGPVEVRVTNPDGQVGRLAGGFTYLAAPTVTSASPVSGPQAGGTLVTLRGTNFHASATVLFADASSTAVTVVDATTIVASAPARTPSLVDIIVRNPDGQRGTLTGGFTYTNPVNLGAPPVVTGMTPARGPAAGGTLVQLDGTGFVAGSRVFFGPLEVAAVTFLSATALQAVAPAGTGDVTVSVMNPDGQVATASSAFAYLPPDALPGAPLTLTGVTPASGPTAGATAVVLQGTGFAAPLEVLFGDVPAGGIVVQSATEVSLATPPHGSGATAVTVIDDFGRVATLAGAFTFVPPPVISTLNPRATPATGGRALVLTGSAFVSGSTEATTSSVVICTDYAASTACVTADPASISVSPDRSQVTFTAPAHAPGICDVAVLNPDGQVAVFRQALTYNPLPTIAGVSPATGSTLGGTAISLNGADFQQGAQVTVNGLACADATVVSSALLRCTTPAGAAGTATVVVVNPDTGTGTLAAAFTYVEPPRITSVNPVLGPQAGGTQVTITGSGFVTGTGGSEVALGSTIVLAADTQVISSSVISVRTPPGTGAVNVTVTNPDGQQAVRNGGFTYVPPTPAPTVSYAIPNRGASAGGYLVQVVGTNFLSGARVYFGSTAAWTEATVLSVENAGTLIKVTAPTHAAGTVDIRVVNTDSQEVTATGAFEFIPPPAGLPLAFRSISPASASVGGNVIATISGQGFRSGVMVYFGRNSTSTWTLATSVEFIGSSLLRVRAPPAPGGLPGVVDLKISNPPISGPDDVVAIGAFNYSSQSVFTLTPDNRLPPEPHDDRFAEIADFTGDGYNDVLVFRNGTARLLTNVPQSASRIGWFAASDVAAMNMDVTSSAVGDLDEDGDLDFVVVRGSYDVYRCLNNGAASFTCAYLHGYPNGYMYGIKLADLDCDGHLDLFESVRSTATNAPNRIMVGRGDGWFINDGSRLPAHYEHTNNVAVGDVDLDGDLDLLLANDDAMQNRLYYNNCNNTPMPPACFSNESLYSACSSYTYNGKNYSRCSGANINWWDANADCIRRGGKLVTLDNAAERTFVRSIITGNHTWIGMTDGAPEGTWRWQDTSSYTSGWCGGEPNGGTGENCAIMNVSDANGCSIDANCASGYNWVCESAAPICPLPWRFTDANYGAGRNFPISGGNTKDVELVDLNNDGFLDAIIGNNPQQTQVYINTAGNFALDTGFYWPQSESNPNLQALYPADVDNDGDTDMITYTGSFRVYVNDRAQGGIGALTNQTASRGTDTRGDTVAIAVGDLDSDLLPDIYAVNAYYQDRLVMNRGYASQNWSDTNRVAAGTFRLNTSREIQEQYYGSRATAFGDLDGDGDQDMVKTVWRSPPRIYLNDGTGTFVDVTGNHVTPQDLRESTWHALQLADLNGDGSLDFVMSDYYDDCADGYCTGQVRVYLNNGLGYFTERTAGNVPNLVNYNNVVRAADFDADGDVDIIEAGWNGERARVLMNGGDPFNVNAPYFFDVTGTYFPSSNAPDYVFNAFLVNIDGIGPLDLYVTRSGQNRLYLNNGNQRFTDVTTTYLPALSAECRGAAFADFDLDGDLDIYLGNNGQDRYLVRESADKFSDITTSALPISAAVQRNTYDVVAGDLNGDGLPDVVSANYDVENVLLTNLGGNMFRVATGNIPWDRDLSYEVDMVDVDGDGDLDLYFTNNGQDRLYINTTN